MTYNKKALIAEKRETRKELCFEVLGTEELWIQFQDCCDPVPECLSGRVLVFPGQKNFGKEQPLLFLVLHLKYCCFHGSYYFSFIFEFLNNIFYWLLWVGPQVLFSVRKTENQSSPVRLWQFAVRELFLIGILSFRVTVPKLVVIT